MVDITKRYQLKIPHTFGWGTDLTDDFGLDPISIVVKPTRASCHPLAKLSDNLAKATGSKEAIERAMRLRGYTNTRNVACSRN
jgi:nicotinate phosphoribosyltransferase